MYIHVSLFILLVLATFLITPFSPQTVLAKRVPMGHPSLSLNLSVGPDPNFDYIILENEESVETLKTDIGAKLYGIIETVILPEIKKEFDEKRDIYSDSYVEGIWGYHDLKESKLDILIGKVPPEYGCNTQSCAHRKVTVDVPSELELSYIRQIGYSVAVYENMGRGSEYDDFVDRIIRKAATEAKILFYEGANVLEDNKEALLEGGMAIEVILLRQYEDISRISVLFLPFEPGVSSTKKPLDMVITSNSYYERYWSYYPSQQSEEQQEEQQPSPEMLQECEEIGIEPDRCSEYEILQKRTEGRIAAIDIEELTRQQSAVDNSLWLIGIGAAVAGTTAFFVLRRARG